ncbi:ABC transporter substrate-binding protein [Clostridium sp. OS1-26]|uniref:ABC transporter substrate-binding protein n=1 Tax=Clostridium sp. OS1-26 TaxID=3070681 RepID=UPI0027DF992B|nr:ABC transporter substrate-binding protein [Clostridium sp. OS1-26]WML36562.1 ABC transporter substrate-binding protein [Clostridium sp. OS1-26]
MSKNAKKFLLFILINMLILTVSCSKNNNVTKQEDTLKGEIKVVTEEKYAEQLKTVADKFKKIHPRVNIEIKIDNNIKNKVIDKSNNQENTIDIINIEDQSAQYFIDKSSEFALDVTEAVSSYKDKISKNKLDNLTVKNKIYGMPWNTSPKVILYRSDVFSKEKINIDDIKTWHDYAVVGKNISKDTGKKFLVNVQDENNNFNIVLANQLGTSYFNKDGKLDFNSKEWLKVIETAKLLYSQELMSDITSKNEFISLAKKGSVISIIADPLYINELMKNIPEDKGKWSVMKLPAFEAGGNRDSSVGGANLIINKNSSNIAPAKGFVEFIATDEITQMDLLNNYGNFPANTYIYTLINFNNIVDYFHAKVWNVFASAEKRSATINYTKYFPIVNDAVRNTLTQSNIKEKDAKLILDSLEKDCESRILQK